MSNTQCSVDGCTSNAKTRGLCMAHYHRLHRYGDPTFIPPQGKLHRAVNVDPITGERLPCAVDGCCNSAKTGGICGTHKRRLDLYGDVNTTLRSYGAYRRIMANGYVGLYLPDHPLAGGNGYVPEHRYVMHELGHDIEGMHVHHLDHDKTNNDSENLVIMTPAEHSEHHGGFPNIGQFQRQTHCRKGHEFTSENTYTNPGDGGRSCYTCKRARWLAGRSRHNYSDDVKAAAVADYVAGAPVDALNEKYGAAHGTIRDWARAAGAPIRPVGRRSADTSASR